MEILYITNKISGKIFRNRAKVSCLKIPFRLLAHPVQNTGSQARGRSLFFDREGDVIQFFCPELLLSHLPAPFEPVFDVAGVEAVFPDVLSTISYGIL